jgi:ribosomal protein S18 acetylase RimI-like enzyme
VPLTDKQAEMIATLLNERNALTVKYCTQRVLAEADNYRCVLSGTGDVIACVEIKTVQWYQCEVLHLTVAKDHERKGHAKALLCEAERVARSRNARILQCTIRDDNVGSRALFEGAGFQRVTAFFNEKSGNNIGVFEKVLVPAR